MNTFSLAIKGTLEYDTVVCGGGFAGAAAAWASASNGAKTLLIESSGELSGDISKGLVPQLLDPNGKGGLVKETYDYLNAGQHTSARRGPRYYENGKRIPGTVVDLEYVKYYLEKRCTEAGVDLMYHSIVGGCELEDGRITSIGVATECGAFRVVAKTYIDATGNGLLAEMAGCDYERGHPVTGQPQPSALISLVTGMPEFTNCDNQEEKNRIRSELESKGVEVSTEGVSLIEYAVDGVWMCAFNTIYDLDIDNPVAMSKAIAKARSICVEGIDRMKGIPDYKDVSLLQVSQHVGIREGRRIFGKYRLTFDDITTGAQFEDAVCRVRFGIDVHKISADDNRDHKHGKKVIPYHIPYRALLPIGCDNLLLAGRCISGDFYAHASYRVIGDVTPTGEAAGYAASICAKQNITPSEVDGKEVSKFIASRGYEL
nr:FAD-dependent oxidoreductase [Clostridia bacterium]